ncbi:DUF4142 domain-containing protein [Streptomyces sp. NPDC007861]|uniref:DUF4142 domain-containing protein n=1 Tax=Streptomyces sp. NPDC007861 TaxID=3154893 RepID=UPI0033EEE87D
MSAHRLTPSALSTGVVVVSLMATIAALMFPVWSYADRSGTGPAELRAGSVATRWGPLSAADRDFLVRVRLAGLWRVPAGQQAVARAPSRAVAVAGEHLVSGHTYLDGRVRDVAARLGTEPLGVELPSQPAEEQRAWLRDLTAAQGRAYETGFAALLRRSQGEDLEVAAHIRHTTRNSLVRALADDVVTAALDHMKMLEATGLVDFDAIARDAAGEPPGVTHGGH